MCIKKTFIVEYTQKIHVKYKTPTSFYYIAIKFSKLSKLVSKPSHWILRLKEHPKISNTQSEYPF